MLDRVEEIPKTLEEAKPDLIDNLLYAKVMQQLRQKAGVQIFEAKLPDPSMYDTGPATIMN
jgi:hypothetical protein